MKRAVVLAAAAPVALVLLAVQLTSLALFGPLGGEPSFARAVAATWPDGAADAVGADRLPGVRILLARAALVRDDASRAQALLAPVPPSADVDDLRARVALADGRLGEAVGLFGAAGDLVRGRATIETVAARDPAAAFAFALTFRRAVARAGAPSTVQAEAAWRAGQLAALTGRPALALALYRDAVAEDPAQETYLLALGFQSLADGDAAHSRAAYASAVAVVPDSFDASLGLAVSEARLGDCAASLRAFAGAQDLAARQGRMLEPAAAGYDATSIAALRRCQRSQ